MSHGNKPDADRRKRQHDRIVRIVQVWEHAERLDYFAPEIDAFIPDAIASVVGVSARTVYRDLKVIEDLRSKGYRVSKAT